ncbi:hypothetical protein [Azoarcus sp. KH32C]|uniref:hypothetical protein n=1 Tax=Azoarcus sp. KH32C TaxID=748247 RepID=UPI0002386800|nr:hypothetical protein [Azoarcus sp. KH32C]BAL23707.1 hypothetical protein AZKH_1385 [Azoarcus sp. KH32C]
MHQRNDSVFQLSLTEIAFTLVFILLILLGWMYFDADTKRQEALARLEQVETLPHAQEAFESVSSALRKQLSDAGVDANEVIQRLLDDSKAAAKASALEVQIQDLNAQLTALAEIKKILSQAGEAIPGSATEEALISALELRARLEEKISGMTPDMASSEPVKSKKTEKSENPVKSQKSSKAEKSVTADRADKAAATPQRLADEELATKAIAALELQQRLEQELMAQLAKPLERGQEAMLAKTLVEGLKANRSKENADLRGQVAFLKAKLEARGGRDYPPCWADETTGKVQFLFTVEVRPDAVAVTPAWPPARDADARALPGIEEVIAKSPHSYSAFRERVRGIFQKSDVLQCRHYVQLRSVVPDAVQSDRARLMVETYFYKIELPR